MKPALTLLVSALTFALAACDTTEPTLPLEDEINAARPISEVLVVPADGGTFTLLEDEGLSGARAEGGFLVVDYDGTRQYFSLTEAARVIVRPGEVALYYQ